MLYGTQRGGKRTSVEFNVFTLVLLNRLFDGNEFSIRISFLKLPWVIRPVSATGRSEGKTF